MIVLCRILKMFSVIAFLIVLVATGVFGYLLVGAGCFILLLGIYEMIWGESSQGDPY